MPLRKCRKRIAMRSFLFLTRFDPMRSLVFSLIAAALLVWEVSAQAQPDYDSLNRVLTDQVVIPAYKRMAEAMKGLAAGTAAFCKAPDSKTLRAARQTFYSAMEAWQRAQP